MGQLLVDFQRNWFTTTLGLALLTTSIILLIWNEGRALQHAHAEHEIYNDVVVVNVHDSYNAGLDGRVVHVTGRIAIEEPLTEPEYGIAVQAVKLKRRVQMYQWVQHTPITNQEQDGISYNLEWRDKLINSDEFLELMGHTNPKRFPIQTFTQVAHTVRLGPFILSNELKDKFDVDFQEITSSDRPDHKDIKLHMGIYYHSDDVWDPQIGDIRIQFYCAGMTGETITVIALQDGGILKPYNTKGGKEVIVHLAHDLTIDEMFYYEYAHVRIQTWKLRVISLLSFNIALSLIGILKEHICEKLENLTRHYVQVPSSNLIISTSFIMTVTATIWLTFRPAIAILLYIGATLPILYSTMEFHEHYKKLNKN